jgi:predicted GNAT family acetyltransferase
LEFLKVEDMAAASVRDNKAQNRFELDVEGAVAFANYHLAPGAVIITHTETPRALRGRGIASELVQGALQLIRADRLKVVAGCGFGASIRNSRISCGDFNAIGTN